MKIDRLERSGLRLRRTLYFKIYFEGKDYYLLEKHYTSDYDGRIDFKLITKSEYEKAVVKELNTKEFAYEDMDKYMKQTLRYALGMKDWRVS
ncbi:MAG: hypothetical protein GX053_12690 [Tissierella sp.]|nr:hypothetical protein [Tissierella sp.]